VPTFQEVIDLARPYDFTVAGDTRTYADLASAAGLAWIAGYADGVGANKNLIVPRDATGKLLAPTSVIRDAHRVKLVVHSWTFRAENQFILADFRIGAGPNARGDITAEYELFLGLGLDGVFADQPDTAVAARAGLAPSTDRRPLAANRAPPRAHGRPLTAAPPRTAPVGPARDGGGPRGTRNGGVRSSQTPRSVETESITWLGGGLLAPGGRLPAGCLVVRSRFRLPSLRPAAPPAEPLELMT
jgi:hypothetical protein